jgi:outer membrane lipoprotein-sorting protein
MTPKPQASEQKLVAGIAVALLFLLGCILADSIPDILNRVHEALETKP